ncbi:Wadjet anti-phage system protein JetD domain-containing protein [Massilia niastensis]|uniref:Wadjet anti-phage system protein JetD domain-containing protein n=1 Tax=Massilia niastensis TaxID=544911 RepID=UPI0003823BE5|nr:Wadjet anti-phage system protein JetD domain-containing protein [Massilia niastensis]
MSGTREPRWSTPADVVAGVQRLWDQGKLLSIRLGGDTLFPIELRLRQPSVVEMGNQFDAVRRWIVALEAGSRANQGVGYTLAWREINHRQLGRNKVPFAAVIETDADALRLIGRAADARRFDQLAQATLDAFPQLRSWVSAYPLRLLEHADGWGRILAILAWFLAHPRPAVYVRQLDIEGVDTKFIETRKALLSELLDQVLPAAALCAEMVGARQFEMRYGLLVKPPLIRFRMLDPAHYINGLSDLTVPVSQFAAMRCATERVFITENEVNLLAFPDVASSMVVFGGGYGIERVAQVDWLRAKEVLYWGDIDTHGFAILDRLRASLPQTRSLLMDAATLHAHRRLWGSEEIDKRYAGDLARLTGDEYRLFQDLRDDAYGERVRMEQERIAYAWVLDAIERA